jgi:two-component system, chemotaxis family, chemotaxis protein CheV
MSSVLDSVDQRTSLAGMNRLEMLLFRLDGKQKFGINVFKVREVLVTPKFTNVPTTHPLIKGLVRLRNQTISVIDLSQAIGREPSKVEGSLSIITEFNNNIQGFLASGVERIERLQWEEIMPPPNMIGDDNYVTAVTKIDGELVEIIDVEKVLSEVSLVQTELSEEVKSSGRAAVDNAKQTDKDRQYHVLVADDSMVARKQVMSTLDQLGLTYTVVNDGKEALDALKAMVNESSEPIIQRVLLVISDIEMPEMDGYTLTKNIRKDPRLHDLYVLLHSSLSGGFNEALVDKVGADGFLSKWKPDELANHVVERIKYIESL